MNKYYKTVKNYIFDFIDYHKSRKKLKQGKSLIAVVKFSNNRCECRQLDCNIDFEFMLLYNIIDVVYDIQDKYNITLNYEYQIGEIDDDFTKDLKTIKVLMWHSKFKRNELKLTL